VARCVLVAGVLALCDLANAGTVGTAAPDGTVRAQEPPYAATTDGKEIAASATAIRQRMLEAATDSSLAVLPTVIEALKHKDTEVRRLAVRVVGGVSWPEARALLVQSVADPAPTVRAEAAHALVRVASRTGDDTSALNVILAQLEIESHPFAQGMLAFAVARLPLRDAASVRRVERGIVTRLAPAAGAQPRSARVPPAERVRFASPLTLLGALRGLEALARRHAATAPLEEPTIALLRELSSAWRSAVARAEGGPTAEAAARLRRLSLSALTAAGAADPHTISLAFGDADDQVRVMAAAAAATTPADRKLIERAVRDQAPAVRAAILRALQAGAHPEACSYVGLLLRDPDVHVAVTAIDLAGERCAGTPATGPLNAIAAQLAPPPLPDVGGDTAGGMNTGASAFGVVRRGMRPATWQAAAHALVALARVAPADALARIDTFAGDSRAQVRVYAARAAALLRSTDLLRRLARDDHDLVRGAAIAGLDETVGHDADDEYIEALGRSDSRLIAAAARALEGTPRREAAVPALLDALAGEPARASPSVRLALLDRLAELGSSASAARLETGLRDRDARVATRVAAVLQGWSGVPHRRAPQAQPAKTEAPSPSDLDVMSTARFTVRVKDVGRFEIKLLPSDSPLAAWQFYQRAREGAFDGLSVDRVFPQVVTLRGGGRIFDSRAVPAREAGLQSNLRGTFSIPVEASDDEPLVINRLDNMAADDTHVVVAHTERGADVLDAVIEGDIIERIETSSGRRDGEVDLK
jgi:HEAT repeat protein/cyclophilin family peptidyl-prolyl cis-trans isomerase